MLDDVPRKLCKIESKSGRNLKGVDLGVEGEAGETTTDQSVTWEIQPKPMMKKTLNHSEPSVFSSLQKASTGWDDWRSQNAKVYRGPC